MSKNTPDEEHFTRFTAGTSYSSTYKTPPENLYGYKPLPASHKDQELKGAAVIHAAHDNFPILKKETADVTAQVAARLDDVLAAFQSLDTANTGILSKQQVLLGLRQAGAVYTDADMALLIPFCKFGHEGKIDYVAMLDAVTGAVKAVPTMCNDAKLTYSWDTEDGFEVCLQSRPEQPTFQIPAWRMAKYADQATIAAQEQHGDAVKVATVLVKLLHDDLLVLPETANEGDLSRTSAFDLSFRRWLYGASTASLRATNRQVGGPTAQEVAMVFEQIVFDAIGVPRVKSHTHTGLVPPTSLRRFS